MLRVEREISLSIDVEMKDREVITSQLDSMKKVQNPFGVSLWKNILERNKDRTLKKKSLLEMI